MKIKKNLTVKSGIDLTPMVDVIFLLIIFFLSSSFLASNDGYKVALPTSNAANQLLEKQPLLTLKKNGDILYQKQLINIENLETFLKNEIITKKINHLIIAGDKYIPYQKIIDIMTISKKAGIKQVSLKTDEQK